LGFVVVDAMRPEDGYFHERPVDDPSGTRGLWFPFHLPGRDLGGFFYINLRPNMNF
jgi:hypothetical protein